MLAHRETTINMQEAAIAQSKNNAVNNQDLLSQFQTDARAQEERLKRLKQKRNDPFIEVSVMALA